MMEVDELLSIVIQCRQILFSMPNQQPYNQLIDRIDQQLNYYKKHNSLGQLLCVNPHNPTSNKDKSLSEKRIFDDSSCEKSPIKKANNNQFSPQESLIFIQSSSKSQSIQESKVQQIILNDIDSRFNRHTNDNQSDTYESLYSVASSSFNQDSPKVNSSLDQNRKCQSVLIKEKQGQQLAKERYQADIGFSKEKWEESNLEIEDFFIIDFNFDQNQYEILPKRQNCHNQPSLLIQHQLLQFYQNHHHSSNNPKPIKSSQNNNNNNYNNNSNKNNNNNNNDSNNDNNNNKQEQPSITTSSTGSTLNQVVKLQKCSSHQNKAAVFPFAQIALVSPKSTNKSRISQFGRYSMQAQINSTESRIMGLQQQLQANSHLQITSQQNIQQTYQMRQVILDLLIHNGTCHLTQIKPTSSMTQLLKLTTNPSTKNKTLQHIILPSFLQMRHHPNSNCNRYTHVIKTYQCVSYGMKYYECERLYVIVERGRRFVEVGNVVKQLIKKGFELRVKVDGEVGNVNAANLKKYVSQIALIPKETLNKYAFNNTIKSNTPRNKHSSTSNSMQQTYSLSPHLNLSDPMHQVFLYCQPALNIKFTIQTYPNSQSKSFSLVLILIYFVVFEYKIIFLTTKGYESTVSEIVNCLVHMLGDLRYIYPVIMAVLTNHHIEFVNAPIPGIVALWGKEVRYKKAVQFMKRKLKEQAAQAMSSSARSSRSGYANSQTTIVVDMNKHEFIDHQFTHKELFIIENIHNYVNNQSSANKNKTLLHIINQFFNQLLLNHMNSPHQYDPKHKWIQMMRNRLQQTQMYEEYMKFQDTINKRLTQKK